MRTVVQISDLHFGSILQPTLEPLLERVWSLEPDLVIVSGDLTQRARASEYLEAQAYLARMPTPRLVLPGNHDVPLYDVVRRFAAPLARYEKYITTDLAPVHFDDELAVVGINSARSFTFKGGTLGATAVADAAAKFDRLANNQAKIVVAHHPFHIPPGLSGVTVVNGVQNAMKRFAACGVDLFLAGHLHLVHQASAELYERDFHATILQAGSATSTRARGEPNSFFVFRTHEGGIEVEIHVWKATAARFEIAETRTVRRVPGPLRL